MSTLGKVDLYNHAPDTTYTQPTAQRSVDNPPPNVEPEKPDLESPIPGYHVEKEQKVSSTVTEEGGNHIGPEVSSTEPEIEDNPVAQDKKDYIVPDPDANIISKRESIAIISDNVPQEITGATARLVGNSIYSDFYQKDKNGKLLEQGMNLVNQRDEIDFFNLVFPKTDKRFNINAEIIGESAKTSYSTEYSEISYTENSARAQVVGIYNDPKKNINAMLFCSGTNTNSHIKADAHDETTEGSNKDKKLSVFGAFKKGCKNGNEYNLGGYFFDDPSLLTKTGKIGGSFYLDSWSSSIGGYINWTKIGESSTINTSHIKVKFLEPKIKQDEAPKEDTSNQTEADESLLQNNNGPKWKKSWSPVVDIRSVAGVERTMVGAEFNAFKQNNATTKVGTFIGGSITNDSSSENNQSTYNGNFAVNFGYNKPLGANRNFEAKATINEQFVPPFKDNILTASASAKYNSPKVSAYGDVKYTKVPDRSYFGAVLGVTGSITKNWDGFIEGSYAVLKEMGDFANTTKLGSIMLGTRINF